MGPSRRCRVALAGAVVTVVTAACSAGPAGPSDPSSVPGQPTPPTTPSAPSSPSSPSGPVTIAVAGDVHFEGVLRPLLDDPRALVRAARPLAAADLAVVNLETSVGVGGVPEPGKRFTFQAPPAALAALAAAGVDVATLANNHALDLGRTPLPSTFAAIRRAAAADPPLDVVGLGRDVDAAFAPAVRDVGGTTVATIGATRAALDPTADPTGQWAATPEAAGTADATDPARLLAAVRRSARSADVVLVHLHWGVQGERCPGADQRVLAADLVAAGADVVVGSHTHTLQGDGRLGRGYVAYGLGNYAWYTASPASSPWTGVLTLTVRPPAAPAGRARVTDATWSPGRVGADGLPAPLDASDRRRFEADRAELRACAGLRPTP